MGRQVNSNVPEAGFLSKKQFNDTGSIAAGDLTIVDNFDNSKGIVFDPSATATGKTVTFKTAANSNNITITLPSVDTTISASSGASTIAAIDGVTASANGADITGSNLTMQSASATVPGLVNTSTQTMAGAKTFSTSAASPTLNASTKLQVGGVDFCQIRGTSTFFIGNQNANGATTTAVRATIGGYQAANVGATSCDDLTAFGYQAAFNITSGGQNTFFGRSAGAGVTTQANNTCMGHTAGQSLTGASCTLIGKDCGQASLSGNQNTAVGAGSFFNKTSGADCTAIGYHAGITLTSGTNCVFVGSGADTSAATANNQIAIGFGVVVTAANKGCVGNSSNQIGIAGIVTPTAYLHVPPCTTAAGTASIKIPSGTVMTSPEDGALEYDGTHLYFTIGGTRKQLDN